MCKLSFGLYFVACGEYTLQIKGCIGHGLVVQVSPVATVTVVELSPQIIRHAMKVYHYLFAVFSVQ